MERQIKNAIPTFVGFLGVTGLEFSLRFCAELDSDLVAFDAVASLCCCSQDGGGQRRRPLTCGPGGRVAGSGLSWPDVTGFGSLCPC